MKQALCALAGGAGCALCAPLGADPWADAVVGFDAGVGGLVGYDNASVVLGSPERYTGEGVFPSAVTPFNSAFGADELVSLGAGGFLTVRFDQPVRDHADNPFGIDLLIFGNAFFFDSSYPDGVAAALAGEGGVVELSADGVSWLEVPGAAADGGFPTLGFSDLTDPYATEPGSVETDFTRPVDPGFDPIGKTFAQLVDGYAGSGGGLGIDIGAVGLSSVRFVRVSNPLGGSLSPEIDGFADVRAVPGPASAIALGFGCLMLRPRRGGRA